jgi:hypothetical protein
MTLTVETWCEALESGKYEQTQESLRRGDAFCCLGVACDLSAVGQWDELAYNVGPDLSDSYSGMLPRAVRDLLSMKTQIGQFRFCDLPAELQEELLLFNPNRYNDTCLSDLNDAGCPFPLIAKVIRARPKGLFREGAP